MSMKIKTLIYTLSILLIASCGERFLEIKPTQRQRTPETIEDYLGLFDNVNYMNNGVSGLGMIGGDEYNISEVRYNNLPTAVNSHFEKKAYTWEEEIYQGGELYTDWSVAYQHIFISNLALDGIRKVSSQGDVRADEINLVRGMALYHRAWNYYNLAQLYCPVYSELNAQSALGLPLRLYPDLTEKTDRASLAQTYELIKEDLIQALALLPIHTESVFRPSKIAVHALLARLYLQLDDYESAGRHADEALKLKSDLLDFNELSLSGGYVFPLNGIGNPEVIFTVQQMPSILSTVNFNADTSLLKLYGEHDLRLVAYFSQTSEGQTSFTGSYNGNNRYFTGLATDELYLIRAECYARNNQLEQAISDLNHLRANRISSHEYSPLLHLDSADKVLTEILKERRKELVMRGTRWEDLRRLNKEGNRSTVLMREVGDQTYSLFPDDPRWVWPIPIDAVIQGGYTQNPR